MKRQIEADLSDSRIKGYINRGLGLSDDSVENTEDGLKFNMQFEPNIFPMYAVNFRDYLEEKGTDISEIEFIELECDAFDEDNQHVDFADEYEKFALVSENSLNGYSGTDILPTGNYKMFGPDVVTTFDLTAYTGYKSDGVTITESALEDAAGINVQLTSGNFRKVRHFVINRMTFVLED